ncbi:MAG: NADH-quinone oxidoreductase subunit C [Bacillota bacterium]|nr:NADH-quinone oxidoreductase subunit C [Bacillota bacterium]
MNVNDLKIKMIELFSDSFMYSTELNGNELYIEADSGNIRDLCLQVNSNLGFPLVSMFANDERQLNGNFAVYYVFADRENSLALILKILINPENPIFPSVSDKLYAAAAYEREIHDMFGITPLNHPGLDRIVFHGNWPEGLYPLRKDYDRSYKPPFDKLETRFSKVEGEGIYEIPVGPVHAGIIEPGHFRFSVAGEPIINLEAQLSYVHKGIEKLSEDESIEKCFYISERISGDETFSNSLAFCQAVERAAGVKIPERAEFSRVVFAEIERLTSHLGDLGGICTDVAYGFAAYQFQMLRAWTYNLADQLCGMRFLRSVNKPGGLRKDFIEGKQKVIAEYTEKIKKELIDTVDIIKSKSMFVDRVENTGILKNEIAVDLNAVGPAGRASGIRHDVRKDFPYAAYGKLEFNVPEHGNGDVNCRMNVKIEECFEAISLIQQATEIMPEGKICESIGDIVPYRFALGMTESPRGENVHWIMTGKNNTVFRYKIRTPSFCNWPALCHAVKGNIVPDFPLINKSFNLSYAGNDL